MSANLTATVASSFRTGVLHLLHRAKRCAFCGACRWCEEYAALVVFSWREKGVSGLRPLVKNGSVDRYIIAVKRSFVLRGLGFTTEGEEARIRGARKWLGKRDRWDSSTAKHSPPTCERFEHFSPRAYHRRSIEHKLITAKSSNRSRGVFENRGLNFHHDRGETGGWFSTTEDTERHGNTILKYPA